ncbi:hypothetical protein ACJ41O_006285 [Fusarium nematophilum]
MPFEELKDVDRVRSNDVGDATEVSLDADKKSREGHGDQATKVVAAHQDYPPMTREMEKRIKRKIDVWTFPPGLFLAPYVVQRVPPGRLLCYGSFTWSSLTLLYAACHSWGAFVALRFLLGFVETVIFPCLALIVQGFYTKAEQPPRNAIIFAYFSSRIDGLFSWLVGSIPESAPLTRWRCLYLITGTVNICYCIFLYFVLPDNHMNAHFLAEEEKHYATQRVAGKRTGIANKDN